MNASATDIESGKARFHLDGCKGKIGIVGIIKTANNQFEQLAINPYEDL